MNDAACGYISRQHTFWCGGCLQWEQFDEETKAQSIPRARRHGWKLTKDRGWVCGMCVKKTGEPGT